MKRFLAMIAVLALVAAACGDDGGEETTTTTAAADGATTTTAAGDDGATTTQPVGQGGNTLADVQSRGRLVCGTNETLPGFGFRDEAGNFSGMDVDYCRAVAAAVFGDANAVDLVPLTAAERFTALQTGQIDLLVRNTTWTQTRDVTLGADFGPTIFYDGQGVAGKASDGFTEDDPLTDIDGSVVCTNAGTTTELNIAEAARINNITIDLQTFEDFDLVMAAFEAGSCDVITTDKSGLIARKAVSAISDDIVILGVTLSKEPLGPMYRANDSQWGDIIDWTVYATLIAEEKGITRDTIDQYLADNPDDLEAQRLFGSAEDELQTAMGLSPDAFYNVVSQVGSYADIYLTNLGPDTPFNVPRGLNSLWIDGGLLYPPPAR